MGCGGMAISRIEELIYGVSDIRECSDFLENWGLIKLEETSEGANFKTLENQIVSLRLIGDVSLPPSHEVGSTVREVIWGVDSLLDLDKISNELSSDREVVSGSDGTIHCQDDSGNYIGFKVSNFSEAKVHKNKLNFHEDITRWNETIWPQERATPIRIGHVVYSIRSEGNWEAAEFYIKRLNFRLSDRSKDGGTFMRAEGSNFHHSIFLFHRQGTKQYFNHVAFEVNSFDEIMTGGQYMLERGAESVSGPGRHSLGSNCFWYFKNPCGGDIEYFADMDRLDDSWEPRYWEESPPYARWMVGEDVLTG